MQTKTPAFQQRILDWTVEVLLAALCFAASVYGVAQLVTEPLLA